MIKKENISGEDAAIHRKVLGLQKSTKIATRLETSVKSSYAVQEHQSPDLVPLTHEWEVFRKKLRSVVETMKSFQASSERVHQDRLQVRYMHCLR